MFQNAKKYAYLSQQMWDKAVKKSGTAEFWRQK